MGNIQMEAEQIRFKNASYSNVQTALSAALTGGGGSTTLAALTDTDIATPSNGQVLTYDGTSEKWENAPIPAQSVTGLSDTNITTPTDGQVLTYDGTSEKWENAPIPAQSVTGLSDTNITTPTDGQVLTYDNASSKWVNADPASGGGGVVYPPADTEIEIGMWNGQTLYRRAYYGLNVTGSSSGDTFDLGITIPPGNVKNYSAFLTKGNFRYGFNYYSSSSSKYNCYLSKTSETNLLLQVSALEAGSLDLYIDYIKTT